MDVGTQRYVCRPSASCFVSTWLTNTAPGDLRVLQSRPRKAVKYRTECFFFTREGCNAGEVTGATETSYELSRVGSLRYYKFGVVGFF